MKTLKPINAGSRGTVLIDRSHLWRGKPCKKLVHGKSGSGGRNNSGRTTVRHIGGGHKRKHRVVDFSRRSNFDLALVKCIEYDPNRTAFIALVEYKENNELSYILAPEGIAVGDSVQSGIRAEIKVGNALPLSMIPVGSVVHNVEIKPNKGGQIARSAGTSAQVVGKDGKYVLVKVSSGGVRVILSSCYATIGVVSNLDNKNIKIGKAGRNRWLGIRPSVRGVAMNPVDHPHGGGEGKSSGGRHPVTPWGFPTRGKKTRKKSKKNYNLFVKNRG